MRRVMLSSARRAPVGLAVGAALVLTLSGCGGNGESSVAADQESDSASTSDTPSAATSSATGAGPECSDLWVDGNHLPRGYKGCSDDGVWVAAEARRCASGQVMVTYGDRFYGALGAKVNDVGTPLTDSDQYHQAIQSCG